MIHIRKAEMSRLGYSGEETFAEIEALTDVSDAPLVATFTKQPENGQLTLVNVTEKRDDPELDWYDNSLRLAYPNAGELLMNGLEATDEESAMKTFEQQLLSYEGLKETLEDAFYYGHNPR